MTEEDAKTWLADRIAPRVFAKLEAFATLVLAENERQNLISASTIETIWARHIVDSAQLIALAPTGSRAWLDIGSGAGFPGLIVAIMTGTNVTLCEPRTRRAEFLGGTARQLRLENVSVEARPAEKLRDVSFDVISARAVGPTPELLRMSQHLATPDTVYILPRGRSAAREVEIARERWHGMFHVERSVTDAESHIIIASGVSPRCSALP